MEIDLLAITSQLQDIFQKKFGMENKFLPLLVKSSQNVMNDVPSLKIYLSCEKLRIKDAKK